MYTNVIFDDFIPLSMCFYKTFLYILDVYICAHTFVQWLHRFLRKWASRAFPASSRSAGARTLRCIWRLVGGPLKLIENRKQSSQSEQVSYVCLAPDQVTVNLFFPTLKDERRVQAVYKGNNDGQLEEHTLQLVDFDVFCLVLHIPSDSRCPVRNSSHSSPASYVFCILKVVVLPLVTPGGCVGAGHHIGQPCCSGCPRAAVDQQRRPPCVEGMGWLMFGSTDVIFL